LDSELPSTPNMSRRGNDGIPADHLLTARTALDIDDYHREHGRFKYLEMRHGFVSSCNTPHLLVAVRSTRKVVSQVDLTA
jgi:hypothetical protein